VVPGELADHQGRTHRVDGELPGPGCGGTGWIDRPSRSVVTVAKVSASHPVALLTRMSTGPNCSSAASNSFPGVAGRTGRLLRRLLAAAVPDAADDRCGVLGPVVAVFLRGIGVIRIIDPQERAQDRAPALGRGRAVAAPMPWLAPVTIAVCPGATMLLSPARAHASDCRAEGDGRGWLIPHHHAGPFRLGCSSVLRSRTPVVCCPVVCVGSRRTM